MNAPAQHSHPPLRAPHDVLSWPPQPEAPERHAALLDDRLHSIEQELAAFRAEQAQKLQQAFVAGMKEVLNDEQFMDNLLTRLLGAFSRRSTKAAGVFTLGLFKELPKTALKYLLVGVLVYQIGGWQFVVSAAKAMVGSKAP